MSIPDDDIIDIKITAHKDRIDPLVGLFSIYYKILRKRGPYPVVGSLNRKSMALHLTPKPGRELPKPKKE